MFRQLQLFDLRAPIAHREVVVTVRTDKRAAASDLDRSVERNLAREDAPVKLTGESFVLRHHLCCSHLHTKAHAALSRACLKYRPTAMAASTRMAVVVGRAPAAGIGRPASARQPWLAGFGDSAKRITPS